MLEFFAVSLDKSRVESDGHHIVIVVGEREGEGEMDERSTSMWTTASRNPARSLASSIPSFVSRD